jgi:hypothetical protein
MRAAYSGTATAFVSSISDRGMSQENIRFDPAADKKISRLLTLSS